MTGESRGPEPTRPAECDPGAGPHARPTTPTLVDALLPIVAMLALFAVAALWLELGTELLVLVLLGAATVAGLVARRHGRSWDDLQAAAGRKIADVLPALLILLAIGLLIGAWVVSGTIPYLVYWGVRAISPEYLPLSAFLATATMSLVTGTSWGSAGTIGVALVGTAAALGAPLAVTAGAVVSGAYLGDKMSPLSDMTNIAAIGAGSELFAHIRHMLYTAVPSLVACLAVYALLAPAGPAAAGATTAAAETLLAQLASSFELGPLTLLPPLIVAIGILRRTPPALAIALSSAVALSLGIWLQGFRVEDALVAGVGGFDSAMLAARGVDPGALDPRVLALVERGGIFSMATTLVVVFAAFLLAGAMEAYGALERLIGALLAAVRGVFGLIAATMAAGATTIALTSHGGVTSLVVGGLFQKAYDERRLARVNLSRSLEDSVTLTEPLMPWTVSAVFMAGTLGVPTLEYLPWAVFCYGGPVFSLAIAATYGATGFGIRTTAAGPEAGADEEPAPPLPARPRSPAASMEGGGPLPP